MRIDTLKKVTLCNLLYVSICRSVVSLLLSHEASVNVQDNKGSTPLHLAAWAGHDHVIKVLLTQGPSTPHINHQVGLPQKVLPICMKFSTAVQSLFFDTFH